MADVAKTASRCGAWLGISLWLLTLVATAAGAQTPTHLARLEIVIWPEYDRPAALVMLRGELSPDVALPATVTLPMPAAAGQPHAVAKQDATGKLLNATYEVQTAGKWSLVHVQTDLPRFRLEYYAPIGRDGERRHLTLEWPGGLELDALAYEIQQPRGAEQMSVTPAGLGARPGPDGLLYHAEELGPRRSDEQLTIEVVYSKADESLTAPPSASASALPTQLPSSPATTSPSSAGGGMPWWLLPVLLAAGALAGAGVAYLLRGRR